MSSDHFGPGRRRAIAVVTGRYRHDELPDLGAPAGTRRPCGALSATRKSAVRRCHVSGKDNQTAERRDLRLLLHGRAGRLPLRVFLRPRPQGRQRPLYLATIDTDRTGCRRRRSQRTISPNSSTTAARNRSSSSWTRVTRARSPAIPVGGSRDRILVLTAGPRTRARRRPARAANRRVRQRVLEHRDRSRDNDQNGLITCVRRSTTPWHATRDEHAPDPADARGITAT